MKDNHFILIQGWMINRLRLKNAELFIYALLYSYGQGRCGFVTTKEELRQHLADMCPRSSFYRAVNDLTAAHLITMAGDRLVAVVPDDLAIPEPQSQIGTAQSQNETNQSQFGTNQSQFGNTPYNIKKKIIKENKEISFQSSKFSDPNELARRIEQRRLHGIR